MLAWRHSLAPSPVSAIAWAALRFPKLFRFELSFHPGVEISCCTIYFEYDPSSAVVASTPSDDLSAAPQVLSVPCVPVPPSPPAAPHPLTMAMVNMNNLLNGKDSRWLQLEVCREFQRNKCSRPDTECKFAHPPANVEVQNGRVTACYDSIKVCHSLVC